MRQVITDFHTHAFPDTVAEKAIPSLAKIAGITPSHNGTAADLLRIERAAGIDRALVLPVVTKPAQFESVNRFAAVLDQAEGLRAFGGIHPDNDEVSAKLRRLREMGFRGIKIHPDYQGVFIDDLRFVRIVREAVSVGLFVVTHAGLDPVSPDRVHCPPNRVAKLLEQVYAGQMPSAPRLILAHLGGVGMQREFRAELLGAPVMIDTSFILPSIPPDDAASLIRDHGVGKTLFATDAPWGNPTDFLAAVDNLPLTDKEKSAIMRENASAILDTNSFAL